VEAADSAGNVGVVDSPSPVRVDLSQPRVVNIRVSAAAGPEWQPPPALGMNR
jgi:hypothetical protein